MRSICQANDMPHRTTVVRWLERYPEFASMYAHARTLQADLMDDMILETANACTPGHGSCGQGEDQRVSVARRKAQAQSLWR